MNDPRQDVRTVVAKAHGRVCLLGDHCDWAQRQVIASSIDCDMIVHGDRASDDAIMVDATNRFHGHHESGFFKLQEASGMPLAGTSLAYVNGVVLALLGRGHSLGGAKLSIVSDIPMKKGLSSSAAICVSSTMALGKLFQLGLSDTDIIRLSYQAEHDILGIGCGMMDQTASLFDNPVFINFRHGDLSYQEIVPSKPLHLVIADLGGIRDTKAILNTLNHHYFEARDRLIVKTLGEDIPRLVRLARAEIQGRCRPKAIGSLMNENQECYNRGLRPFCPEELDSRALYRALDVAGEHGAFGAKWTGAGGSGSIIALAGDPESQLELSEGLSRVCDYTMLSTLGPTGTNSITMKT